jgi:hypothetical protein
MKVLFSFFSAILATCLCCKKVINLLDEDEKYAQMSAEYKRDIKYYYGYK